jgi:hypothetical protein
MPCCSPFSKHRSGLSRALLCRRREFRRALQIVAVANTTQRRRMPSRPSPLALVPCGRLPEYNRQFANRPGSRNRGNIGGRTFQLVALLDVKLDIPNRLKLKQ